MISICSVLLVKFLCSLQVDSCYLNAAVTVVPSCPQRQQSPSARTSPPLLSPQAPVPPSSLATPRDRSCIHLTTHTITRTTPTVSEYWKVSTDRMNFNDSKCIIQNTHMRPITNIWPFAISIEILKLLFLTFI